MLQWGDFHQHVSFFPLHDHFNISPPLTANVNDSTWAADFNNFSLNWKTLRRVDRDVGILMPWPQGTVTMETFSSAPHDKETSCVKGQQDEGIYRGEQNALCTHTHTHAHTHRGKEKGVALKLKYGSVFAVYYCKSTTFKYILQCFLNYFFQMQLFGAYFLFICLKIKS